MGKRSASRRYNQLPLLRSSPGGFEGSWPYRTFPCQLYDSASLCAPFQAERPGFEPGNQFCRLHAFQACLFSHSSISPLVGFLSFAAAKVCLFFDTAKQKSEKMKNILLFHRERRREPPFPTLICHGERSLLQSFNVAMQNLMYFFVVDINDQSFACKGRSSKSLSRAEDR